MEAPSSPREPSPAVAAISTAPALAPSRKRKHAAISQNIAASPAPSDPGVATPTPGAENVVLHTRHIDLSARPRLTISRHPGFIPIAPGSSYHNTDPHCNNRLNFRYTPAGLAPPGSALPFRTIESAPTSFRVSWEDRSMFVKVTQDGLGLKGEKGFRSARCNAPVRAGKWYMEVKVEMGGGEKPPDSQRREGSHIRLGWARREAPLNGPAGSDGYSYAFRDKTGEKVHLSRPRPYGKPFKPGDVIGMYISLPANRPPPNRKDPYDPARIKRERIAIEFKGQEYFESLEYAQSKEMIALMGATDKAKANSTSSMPSSATKKSATVKNLPSTGRGTKTVVQEPAPMRPLPTLGSDSYIAFFVNGECQGVAFQDLYDYLPLRDPNAKAHEKKKAAKDGYREHKQNPFDDGTLGYYPFVSLFNEARVRINPGPDFDYMPPPDIDAVLSSTDPMDTDVKPSPRTWRPMCERYPEFIAEQKAIDDLEEQEAQGTPTVQHKADKAEKQEKQEKSSKPEKPEKPEKAEKQVTERDRAQLDKLEAHRAKRRAQAARRRERKAQEDAEAKRRKLGEAAASTSVRTSVPADDAMADASHTAPGTPSTPYFQQLPGTAAASPAPTVASDVHIPEVVSRYDSSAYNSEYEMDVEPHAHALAEDDRAASHEP
ncbi:uncharacterized protein C8Q71DRAFT_207753 [Rhodofomes roseus]|uniref:B30.2/SPRY domain-containing protein n=1 Tax=Rhodofomes roseus TaxID=34475 RepID=A0ABQ8KTX8_9APHY|nr:uncharacterized protein C8Q71DRAFT_207753 [Rhodofomes roseus]KAH9842537.1 hypothetical protein C8Q71DRAFT_207753 [Rhodofomes roseus]